MSKVKIDSAVSKGSATKAEQHNILYESITYQETSLATEKHEKHKKIARVDFLGAKGVVHLSSDYYIMDGDQTPTSKKGWPLACSESAEPTLKSAEPIAVCSESARPTASTACPESARPTPQLSRLTTPIVVVPTSAQVGLADFQSAKLTFLVPAAADASLDDSAPIVVRSLEMKSNIIQIKDIHFSNMVNKVQNTNILLKLQSGHTISIYASIRDILASSYKRRLRMALYLFMIKQIQILSANK